jgi:hypothetical protein
MSQAGEPMIASLCRISWHLAALAHTPPMPSGISTPDAGASFIPLMGVKTGLYP